MPSVFRQPLSRIAMRGVFRILEDQIKRVSCRLSEIASVT